MPLVYLHTQAHTPTTTTTPHTEEEEGRYTEGVDRVIMEAHNTHNNNITGNHNKQDVEEQEVNGKKKLFKNNKK